VAEGVAVGAADASGPDQRLVQAEHLGALERVGLVMNARPAQTMLIVDGVEDVSLD
jgi:hypothetical protein